MNNYMTTCTLISACEKSNLIMNTNLKDDIFWSNGSKCHLFFDAQKGITLNVEG